MYSHEWVLDSLLAATTTDYETHVQTNLFPSSAKITIQAMMASNNRHSRSMFSYFSRVFSIQRGGRQNGPSCNEAIRGKADYSMRTFIKVLTKLVIFYTYIQKWISVCPSLFHELFIRLLWNLKKLLCAYQLDFYKNNNNNNQLVKKIQKKTQEDKKTFNKKLKSLAQSTGPCHI